MGSECFKVTDYCNKNDIVSMNTEGALHLPDKISSGSCLLLTLTSNHIQKKVSKLLYFCTESERTRWTEALSPKRLKIKSQDGEVENAMCTTEKVLVKCSYTAREHDELSLVVGDIISIITKSSDGWYRGELNGQSGWFPGNYVVDANVIRFELLKRVGSIMMCDVNIESKPVEDSLEE